MQTIEPQAKANHERIVELKRQATRSFILLGEALLENKQKRYFSQLGYPTFEAYIESPQVDLGRRSVYSLIAIYETFVLELGYSEDELSFVDYSKLDRILPLIHVQPVAHEQWVSKAKRLPRRELEQEVKHALESQHQIHPKPEPESLPREGFSGWLNTVVCGDCLELLRQLPDESIDCCITSPPYWHVRDYGVEGQLGLEPTFTEYIDKLCTIFDEVRRVTKVEGTCWVVMGDTYSGSGCGSHGYRRTDGLNVPPPEKDYGQRAGKTFLPDKCLLQIPARFAIEMTSRGWILRNEIIWHKPNGLPSSAKDRFTVDYEKVYFFVKGRQYDFNQQTEPRLTAENRPDAIVRNRAYGYDSKLNAIVGRQEPLQTENLHPTEEAVSPPQSGRNQRSVWSIPTQPNPAAHFAVFPLELVSVPIAAGCRSGGVVLDPFCGSGTTLVVAVKLGRNYLGFELNRDYVRIAEKRLSEMES